MDEQTLQKRMLENKKKLSKKRKRRRRMLQRIVPIFVAFFLIAIVIGVCIMTGVFDEFTYSTETADLNDYFER